MALNVWKSTLPIPAIKLKRQRAQTHNSEGDMIVELSIAGTGSNQTNTLTVSVDGDWNTMSYGAGNVLEGLMAVFGNSSFIFF